MPQAKPRRIAIAVITLPYRMQKSTVAVIAFCSMHFPGWGYGGSGSGAAPARRRNIKQISALTTGLVGQEAVLPSRPRHRKPAARKRVAVCGYADVMAGAQSSSRRPSLDFGLRTDDIDCGRALRPAASGASPGDKTAGLNGLAAPKVERMRVPFFKEIRIGAYLLKQ